MLEPFPNAVRVHADNYELERHRNGATGTLVQQRARPFAAPAAPRPELAAPFAEDVVEPDGGKRKRRKRELKGQLRSYKVRMIPTAEQKRELKRCFSAARHSYNWTLVEMEYQRILSKEWDETWNGPGPRTHWSSAISMRNAYFASGERPDWSESVNRTFVAAGVERAVNAYKSNWAKLRKDPTHRFDIKPCSHRRTPTESLAVAGDGELAQKHSPLLRFQPLPFANSPKLRAECLACFGSKLKAVGGIRLQDKGHVIDRMLAVGSRLPEECAILWDKRTDDWHFKFVYDLPAPADPGTETKSVVATDPGVRKFQTFYSPTTGEFGELFKGGRQDIRRRNEDIDRRVSAIQLKVNEARRAADKRPIRRLLKRMRRKLARERKRLRGFVEAGHYAAARFLLTLHSVVIAPKLETSQLVQKEDRVLADAATRDLQSASHYKFQQRLRSAAFRFPGRTVVDDGGEPGTSRTCTHCGQWHADLGASSVFRCPACGIAVDRDLAGARNNFFAAWQMHAARKTEAAMSEQRKRRRQGGSGSSSESTEVVSPVTLTGGPLA